MVKIKIDILGKKTVGNSALTLQYIIKHIQVDYYPTPSGYYEDSFQIR
jgi:hypothetical protein